jgi:exonuclease VII small subunit
MRGESVTRNFISALNKLVNVLETLEGAIDRLEEVDPIYERIVSEIRTDLEQIWSISDRLARRVERLKY